MTVKTARRKTRKLLYQKLYASQFTVVDNDKFIEAFYDDIFSYDIDQEFFEDAFDKIIDNQKTISGIIKQYAPKFEIETMNKGAIVALSLGIYEALFNEREHIGAKIIINESVEITKIYSDPKSKGLVHAVLHAIIQDIKDIGREAFIEKYAGTGIDIYYGPK